MKIGIATFQWSNNYGAVLQAYALQTKLKELGHDVKIINYYPTIPVNWIKTLFSSNIKSTLIKWEALYKSAIFNRYRKKYLSLTKPIFSNEKQLLDCLNEFEVLVAGSDQVWNPMWLNQHNTFWDLYFFTKVNSSIFKMSYAASLGFSNLESLKRESYEKFRNNVKGINAVSVREESAIQMINEICEYKSVKHVSDPTLLLSIEHYLKVFNIKKNRQQHVFSYILHGQSALLKEIEQSSLDFFNCKLVKSNLANTFITGRYSYPSPERWLSNIYNANVVITNSFHGLIFCLIFHKPFILLLVDGKISSMNSRVIEILQLTGLQKRAVSNFFDEKILNEDIDWAKVDENLSEFKNNSISFLKETLSKF